MKTEVSPGRRGGGDVRDLYEEFIELLRNGGLSSERNSVVRKWYALIRGFFNGLTFLWARSASS